MPAPAPAPKSIPQPSAARSSREWCLSEAVLEGWLQRWGGTVSGWEGVFAGILKGAEELAGLKNDPRRCCGCRKEICPVLTQQDSENERKTSLALTRGRWLSEVGAGRSHPRHPDSRVVIGRGSPVSVAGGKCPLPRAGAMLLGSAWRSPAPRHAWHPPGIRSMARPAFDTVGLGSQAGRRCKAGQRAIWDGCWV